jgi:hypothetical protein
MREEYKMSRFHLYYFISNEDPYSCCENKTDANFSEMGGINSFRLHSRCGEDSFSILSDDPNKASTTFLQGEARRN